jgi:geranylgeranyl pyrophosphate synthase
MYFLEQSDGSPTATLVRRIVDGEAVPDDEVREVTDIISRSSAIDQSLDVAVSYIDRARDRLHVIEDSSVRGQLSVLANLAADRLA